MRRLILPVIIIAFLLIPFNIVSIVSASEGSTYFSEDFETGSDGWKKTDGILFFPRTQRFIKHEGSKAFRLTGLVEKHGKIYGSHCRYEHAVNIPVKPNLTFEFAYYFVHYYFRSQAQYVGYLINFSNGIVGYYISLLNGHFDNISAAYIMQYPAEPSDAWNHHTERIYSDYKRTFGSVPPDLRIIALSLVIGDPYHMNIDYQEKNYPRILQTAYFDDIKIYDDTKNYPPDIPSRPSGPEKGNINTTYQYSITATDVNDDALRIHCSYEDNKSIWSEWIRSGDSVTFQLKWMSEGTYKIQAYAQDTSRKNSSWSEPLTVYISNTTNPLTVKKPNGNEKLFLGDSYDITWSSTNQSDERVKIELFQHNTLLRTITDNTLNNGNYRWQIPTDLPPEMDYQIKISSRTHTEVRDFSDNPFALFANFDVSCSPLDIMSKDWTPGVNDTIDLCARINFTGTEAINATINFYIKQLNQTPPQHTTTIHTSTLHDLNTTTFCYTQWRPTQTGEYQLSVEIQAKQNELSTLNNKATASQIIRVGATDDDLCVFIPPETLRIRTGHSIIMNCTVICYTHDLNNVRLEILNQSGQDDFQIKTQPTSQDITQNTPYVFSLEIIPTELPFNISSIQKEIEIRTIGYLSDTNNAWQSNLGYIVVEVYQPQSLITEVAVISLLLAGIFGFFSLVITETGKYKLFSFLSLLIPLFTHIRSEEVLENFVRGQIYGYIKTNPGSHYNNIKKSLDIGNGTLAHHLKMLEKTGLIKSRQEGIRYRLFYPTEMKFPEARKYMLSEFQIYLLKIIGNKPGISQKEIINLQDESQQTVSYNLKELEKVQEISSMKKHGKKYYFLVPNKQTTAIF